MVLFLNVKRGMFVVLESLHAIAGLLQHGDCQGMARTTRQEHLAHQSETAKSGQINQF